MEQYLKLNELKKNDITFFKFSNKPNATVWFINHYNNGSKTYTISKHEDLGNWREVKTTKEVFVDFEY